MTQLKTIDASKITWTVFPSTTREEPAEIYCADGDGILQVVVYADRIELLDQLDVCQTWPGGADIAAVLEVAQAYLEANYAEIYEDAMHWNDDNDADLFAVLNEVKS
jgi:hypothetical protein